MRRVFVGCIVGFILAGCANLSNKPLDVEPSLTTNASCTPAYITDKKKAGPIHEANMKQAFKIDNRLFGMNYTLLRSYYPVMCWKVVSQNTTARTIVAIGQSVTKGGSFNFVVRGELRPNVPGQGFVVYFKNYFATTTSNANSANPYRHIVNFSTPANGGGYLTTIRQVGSSLKIHDYPKRGPYIGTNTLGDMLNFANPAASSSPSKFEYDSQQNSFTLVPQATTSQTAVNYGNAPVISVKGAIESKSLAVQFDAECESQKFPNDPCPKPPAVVPVPSPDVKVEICVKRECGSKAGTFARNWGITIVAEFRLFYDTTKTVGACANVVKTGAYTECGFSAGFVAVDGYAAVRGAKATDAAFGDLRSCLRQPREVCHTY